MQLLVREQREEHRAGNSSPASNRASEELGCAQEGPVGAGILAVFM